MTIAEAFSEPHDRIRLVRLVAALEALAALSSDKKADALASRCAFAGGWTDGGRAVQIVDDVTKLRSAAKRRDVPGPDIPGKMLHPRVLGTSRKI